MPRPLLRDAAELGALLIGGAIIIVVLGVLALAWAGTANAHDRKAMTDPDRGKWFDSLTTPNGASCCNLKDCHQTEADWHAGQWWAVVEGKWTPIPPEKVLSHPTSIDGEAYVCNAVIGTPPTIYCFVPPVNGY